MSFFSLRIYQNRCGLGELTAVPILPSWFQGGHFAAGVELREDWVRREGGERGKIGKGGKRKRGKLGNSAFVVGR